MQFGRAQPHEFAYLYTHAFYSCMQRAYTNNLPRSWFYCSYLQRRLLAAIDRCFAAGKQPVPAPRRLVRTVPSFVQSATGSLSLLLASLIVCAGECMALVGVLKVAATTSCVGRIATIFAAGLKYHRYRKRCSTYKDMPTPMYGISLQTDVKHWWAL